MNNKENKSRAFKLKVSILRMIIERVLKEFKTISKQFPNDFRTVSKRF